MVPATPETEAGDCLSSGGGGCLDPWSCHCTPAWATEQNSVPKILIIKERNARSILEVEYKNADNWLEWKRRKRDRLVRHGDSDL